MTIGDWQEVDWIIGNTIEALIWRTCDFCDESYVHDVWANKPVRKFYRSEEQGNLIACEHCLPAAMADEPTIVDVS